MVALPNNKKRLTYSADVTYAADSGAHGSETDALPLRMMGRCPY